MSIGPSKQYSTSLKVGMIVDVRMSGRLVVTWLPVPIEPWAAVAPRNVAPSAATPTTMRLTERARLGELNILESPPSGTAGPIDLSKLAGRLGEPGAAVGREP